MKIVLESCKHPHIAYNNDYPYVATCLSCYERLSMSGEPLYPRAKTMRDLVKAKPVWGCPHRHKEPVSATLTATRPYRDAMCQDCGVVLRHPDGPGAWEEVLFYGYLIHESP